MQFKNNSIKKIAILFELEPINYLLKTITHSQLLCMVRKSKM